ncbi:MAG: hypothetical protein GEU74_14960, partial [Nitriliruptorales bacterium]|nr:hypothetical protein [Nitriliruptorales bacterium]
MSATYEVDTAAAEQVAAAAGYPMAVDAPLPLDLAVLVLHVGDLAPLVPVTVPPTAAFDDLTAVGEAVADAFADDDVRAVVVAAGDLSAGLTEQSPLHLVPGAISWDEQVVAAVDSGRLEGLSRLGPQEARRVGGHGWPALAVLHGATARFKLGMVVRHYSAPRGVGYMVAHGS